jgi:translation initiation factor IF-3
LRISRRKFKPKPQRIIYAVNDLIRHPMLRLVDEEGEHIGVVTTDEARRLAAEREMDVVVIQPTAEPPVAKIVDFGKYKFEKEKEARKQKASAKTVEVKGIRLSVRIGQHDLDVRKDKAKEFLDEGNKVKVEIILRGREKRFGDVAHEVMDKFIASLHAEMPVKVEQPFTRQGGQLTIVVGKA